MNKSRFQLSHEKTGILNPSGNIFIQREQNKSSLCVFVKNLNHIYVTPFSGLSAKGIMYKLLSKC